jgi:hypothetical protein
MAGGNGIQNDPPGVGFKFVNGNLYACESVFGDPDFEEYTSQILGVDITQRHIYRVQYVVSSNSANFYVDGVLMVTLTLHESFDVGLIMFSAYLKNTAASQKFLWVSGVYYSIIPFNS